VKASAGRKELAMKLVKEGAEKMKLHNMKNQ
jgi:hypothetical protein